MLEARKKMHDFLAAQRNAQTHFLAELVKTPSDNPPGDCQAHAAKAASLLEVLGFVVERHQVPADEVKASGMISCTNLVVREKFLGGGPTIALNAHGDVVPPGLGWSSDPYGAEIRDGAMIGRGVAVSKSDFATYAWALLALKHCGAPLAGSLELHLTYDEETGGAIGPQWLLQRRLSKPDFAMCAGFSYGVITAHNGCLHLEVEVVGRSGHAAEPHKGRDALEAAALILNKLYAYRKTLQETRSSVAGIESPTLVVGLISGGINTNVVPDRVVFRLDRRVIPEENPAAAEQALRNLINNAVLDIPDIRVEVRRILLAKPFVPLAGQERLVQTITRHAQAVMGTEIKAHGVPIYTDARHYSEAGVPTVLYGAGPRTLEEANGHRADERLLLEDLYRATEVVALSLLDMLTNTP